MANVFSITITAVDRATAIVQKVNASIAKTTKPIADVKASVDAFSKATGIDKVGRGLEKVGNIASDTARRIGSIAPPLAAIASVGTIAGIAALAHNWGRSAVEIANTASVIGVSTDQLQKYRGAARLAGLSDSDMTNGLKAVGSAFEDAAAGRDTFAAGVMSSKNISIHRLADGSVDAVRAFNDVAAAAAKITNVQARGKFLEIFGMGGLQPMIGRVAELKAQFEKLNGVMSPAQIAQGERYNESMVALDVSVDKLKNSIGAALAPALTQVVNQLIPIADKYGPKIAQWIESVDWSKAARETGEFAVALGGLKGAAIVISAITFAKPIAAIAQMSTLLLPLMPALAPLAALAAGGAYTIEKLKDSTESGHFVPRYPGAPIPKPLPKSQTNAGLWDRFWSGTGKFVPRNSTAAHGSTSGAPAPIASSAPAASPDASAGGPAPVATPAARRAGRASDPLGIRSNNPLNLSDSGVERVYATPEDGLADAVSNLQRNYQGLTIAQIQKKWTGGAQTGNSPEQIANYTGLMSQASGLKANQVPDLSDPSVVSSLVSGMIRAENGKMPYTAQQIGAATLQGMRRTPSGSSSGDPRFAATPAAQQPDGSNSGDSSGAPVTGSVQVDVTLHNAPKGSRVTVASRGNVSASARIGTSALMEPAV
ncbi:hypothetical protein [Caballeronia sp. dw_19]|uniref:hypothetical protein n=1 Tax=Caballeronia sp. dw_19 TaxID=2719791 RepID=UPI001BCE5CBA|nr:hypothetical protein [Caballeronia sp. dw_19]